MTAPSPPAILREVAVSIMLGTHRSGEDDPHRTLSAAALAGTRARAGFEPTEKPEAVPSCPPDGVPSCSDRSAAHLTQLLQNPDAVLIEEWALLANEAGRRAPDHLAPAVIDWWSRQQPRPAAVFHCLGVRGPWLASFNPAWAPRVSQAAEADNAEVWQSGTVADRVGLLRTLRGTDPGRALELVGSTWPTDGAAERTRFIETLTIGLSSSDEPFLEAALDDRSKTVRRQAAAVLAMLPGSAFRARMEGRLRSMISVDGRRSLLKRGQRIAIEPPATFDPAWERDGVEEKPPTSLGPRAWWARQLIARADLTAWTACTGLAPEAVIDALREDNFFTDAFDAMLEAGARCPDPAWSRALASEELGRKDPRLHLVGPLWQGLAGPLAEEVLIGLLRSGISEPLRLAALAAAPWRWSPGFSRDALQTLGKRRRSDPAGSYSDVQFVAQISHLLDPSAAEQFERLVDTLFPEPVESVRMSLDRVRFRLDMHKEFRP